METGGFSSDFFGCKLGVKRIFPGLPTRKVETEGIEAAEAEEAKDESMVISCLPGYVILDRGS